MSTSQISLGEKIRLLRTLKNFKQEWLADATGLSQKTISKIESNGHAKPLSRERLHLLAGAFGVTAQQLEGNDLTELLSIIKNGGVIL